MNKKNIQKNHSLNNTIIDKYVLIIGEFFELLNQNDILNEFENLTPVIFIGLNTINRVFEYVLIKTKNFEKTIYYSQKTYLYYLEYMEQMIRSDLSNSLDHSDAILFVYKKTIFDLYDSENNQSFNTMSNIMTLSEEIIPLNEIEWSQFFIKMFKMVNVLFYWENDKMSFSDRFAIYNLFLFRFLSLGECIEINSSYLEIIQQKLEITTEKYTLLLNEILEKQEKKTNNSNKLIKSNSETIKNDICLIKFFAEESLFIAKFEENSMKEFVRWLYLPV